MPRGRSAREFALDLAKFGRVTRAQANTIFRKIIIDLDTSIVLGTPVDTGRARGNWFPSIGTPATTIDDNASDKSGSEAIGAVQGVASQSKIGDVAWFTNNLPYILVLENGSSTQAPQGMVDLNLQRAANKFGGRVSSG